MGYEKVAIVKLLRTLVICSAFIGIITHSKQRPCAFVTSINCPNECDDRKQFKECDGDLYGKTFFSFRPQDSDSSRRILDWFNADYVQPISEPTVSIVDYLDDQEWITEAAVAPARTFPFPWHNIFTMSVQWTRSFDRSKIARWFFFNGEDLMTVGIPSDEFAFDINGSQIGLSFGTQGDALIPGKIGNVWARPFVENLIIDLDYWNDLGGIKDGLWSRVECVVVQMKTHMQMRSFGSGVTSSEYPAGLMTLESIGEEFCATTPVPYDSIICALQGNEGWGAVQPLHYGKFPLCAQTLWGVAGIHFDLGYDFYKKDWGYVAGSMQVVFPTGTRPKSIYVFEPVIGANKSWQFGATFIAHYMKEYSNEKQVGLYAYLVGTHLFKSRQDRVFGLKNNGAGSQLLLLKQFNAEQTELINAEREANIFNGTAQIGAAFMFDGSCMLQFSKGHFVGDLGYNLWFRTKEIRSKVVGFKGFYENGLGIKGRLFMERNTAIGCPGTEPQCVYNLTTDSKATIVCSTETDVDEDGNPTPVFITPSDIEYGSALAPMAMTHKIFAATGFKSSWFALVSAEVEFSSNNAALNQWGIMMKIGKDF